MKTVKEWLQSKTPQFSIIERECGSGRIKKILQISNNLERNVNVKMPTRLLKFHYFNIVLFHEDLIHITFVLVLPKFNVETGEVDSLDTSNEFICELNSFSKTMGKVLRDLNIGSFKNVDKIEVIKQEEQ